MGMCLEEFGRVSVEVRRESFIIHPNDEAWQAWRHGQGLPDPHPEFYLSDLDDLIAALEDARDYIKNGRKR
jgi:hypothetical protein